MTFVIDKSTKLEVKAAARKSRDAKVTDTPGVTITQYVKTGTPVVVRYEEANGANHALSVRPVSSPGDGSEAHDAAKIAEGTVKAVSLSQVTLDSGGKDLTFAINADTDVLARGASKTTKAAGGKTTIADFVHNGDQPRLAIVTPVEVPARNQSYLHGSEKVWRDLIENGALCVAEPYIRLVLRIDCVAGLIYAQGHRVGVRGR